MGLSVIVREIHDIFLNISVIIRDRPVTFYITVFEYVQICRVLHLKWVLDPSLSKGLTCNAFNDFFLCHQQHSFSPNLNSGMRKNRRDPSLRSEEAGRQNSQQIWWMAGWASALSWRMNHNSVLFLLTKLTKDFWLVEHKHKSLRH